MIPTVTGDVFGAMAVFVPPMSTDVGPDLSDREVTGVCSVRCAGTLAKQFTGEHEMIATNVEVSNVEAKNFMGIFRLSGFSEADRMRRHDGSPCRRRACTPRHQSQLV